FRPLIQEPEVADLFEQASDGADGLINLIRDDLGKRKVTADDDYRLCLWFVLSITGVGVVLMTGSLRFFYRWVFYPIRDLQLGVDKVSKGDFKHEIRVES